MIQHTKNKTLKIENRSRKKICQDNKLLHSKKILKTKDKQIGGVVLKYRFNKDIIIFILTLLGSDLFYSKLTGNSGIIDFVKQFFKKIAYYLSRNLDIALALLVGSYLVTKDRYNLFIRIQYFVKELNDLLNYNQTSNPFKILTQGNFIFIVFLTFIYSFVGINGYRNLVSFISRKIFNSIKYKSLVLCHIFNNISQFLHNDHIKSGLGSIVTISSLASVLKIIEDIIEVFFSNLTYQQKEYWNSLNSIKNNLTLNQVYQVSCIYTKFMYKSCWEVIHQTNQFLNYPIFNFKLIGIDIPIPQTITTIPNYKLNLNIGLTPSIIFLTIIVKLLKYSYQNIIIKKFNYFMYYFFLIISYNNKIVKKVIDQQQLSEHLKDFKQNVVLFYQSSHYNNIIAIIKFYQITTHLQLHNLNLWIIDLDLNEDKYFLQKLNIKQLPCIKFYEGNSEIYNITSDQIVYSENSNHKIYNFKKSFINGLINLDYSYKDELKLNMYNPNKDSESYINNNLISKIYQIYHILDYRIQSSLKYFLIDSFENSIYYNLDIFSFANCYNCYKDYQLLDYLVTHKFKDDQLILLYLYNDNISEIEEGKVYDKNNDNQRYEYIIDSPTHYLDKEKLRKNKLIPKYTINENLESFSEFYKVSSRIGNKTKSLTFIMAHIDSFLNCKFYQRNYQLKINQLTMFYQKFARFNYDSFLPLINQNNDYTPLEYYLINDYKNILNERL